MLNKLKSINKTQRKTILLIVALVSIVAGSSNLAFAQTSSTTPQKYVESGLIFAAAVGAGIEWSISGYIAAWRAHRQLMMSSNGATDPSWKGFEFGKMKDDIFIGFAVGAMVFLTNSFANINIIDVPTFIAAMQSMLGLVVPADKILVGGGLGK